MNAIDVVSVRLTWTDPWQGPAVPHLLRGAIGSQFRDNSLFHQHEENRVVYRYPRIQYRWDRDGPMVVGFGEGVRSLIELPWAGLTLQLGARTATVLEAGFSFGQHTIQPSQRLQRYRFGAPWLPFNQDKYQNYQQLKPAERQIERDRLAVAGLLVAMRGLGVEFPQHLYAAFELWKSRPCWYKDTQLVGLSGTLFANVDLPDGFSLGRAVSHGYGWLRRAQPNINVLEKS